ncbi:hypothetical protein LC040_05515 [Bacillus tianshenii]|nr:hypothetical protein LC040_05515 [Bacillus tianshenii]
MSLKAIEMQVALPRTQEVGKLQEQLQQRGQHTQDHLAAGVLKEQEKKRQQVGKNEQSEKNKLNGEKEESNQHNGNTSKKRKAHLKQEDDKQQHPYKGNLIDIEG